MRPRDPSWLRRWWPWFTALAAGLLVVGFGAPETVGVWHPGVGGTYTESLQGWLGTDDGDVTLRWAVLAGGLWAFAIWFPPHLLGWWPWERGRE